MKTLCPMNMMLISISKARNPISHHNARNSAYKIVFFNWDAAEEEVMLIYSLQQTKPLQWSDGEAFISPNLIIRP